MPGKRLIWCPVHCAYGVQDLRAADYANSYQQKRDALYRKVMHEVKQR